VLKCTKETPIGHNWLKCSKDQVLQAIKVALLIGLDGSTSFSHATQAAR
jgi:hypothetical protein